jgi:MFS family permease
MPNQTPGRGQALPGARGALTLLFLINLLNYIDRYVLSAAVPHIRHTFFGPDSGAQFEWFHRHLGFTPQNAMLGLLSMAFMVTYTIVAPVFGRTAERRSRWAIVGVGVLLWSIASGASGLATTFLMLLITRCFVGIGEAAYGPVAPAIISDLYPVKVRGQVLSRFYIAIPVGTALGYVLGGAVSKSGIGAWAAASLGIQQESWRWAFYLVVIPGLVLGAWSFFKKDPPRGQADLAHGHAARAVEWSQYLVLFRTPSYVLCTLGMAAMTFAMGGIGFWMPDYLEARAGHPQASTEIFGGILVVAGLLSTLAGGLAGDRLRTRFPGSYFLVSGAAMLVGLPAFLLTLGSPFPWIWPWIFVALFCLFFNTGPSNTILANVVHPSMRPAAFALNILIIHSLGDVISPVVIGLLTDYFHGDMNASFRIVGLTFLVAGGLWLAGARYLERDTARAVLQ